MNITAIEEDEDDWIELERADAAGALLPAVQARMTVWGDSGAARAFISFRREAAEWLREKGPRFFVQVGGLNLNRLRLVPNQSDGKFCIIETRGGTLRLSLGKVPHWPNEPRDAVAAKYEIAKYGAMVLELPEDWARAGRAPTPKQPVRPRMKEKIDPAPQIKVTTEARGLVEATRLLEARRGPPQRGLPASSLTFGDPPPGQSALDQRMKAAGADDLEKMLSRPPRPPLEAKRRGRET
jgi:hypothetical protein